MYSIENLKVFNNLNNLRQYLEDLESKEIILIASNSKIKNNYLLQVEKKGGVYFLTSYYGYTRKYKHIRKLLQYVNINYFN